MNVLVLLSSLFCALLFGVSGLRKLGRRIYYARLVDTWLPFGPVAARALATGLGGVEIGIALALCLNSTRVAGAVAAVALLLIYLAGLASALLRGRSDLDCGCGGSKADERIGWNLVLRNLLLALLAATPLLFPTTARFEVSELALALIAAIVFQLLYAGLEALPARGGRGILAGGRG